jgi:uncharacterized protein (DUF1778 family)
VTRKNGDSPADEQSGETHNKRKNISVRPMPEQLDALHERAASFGYKSVSQYLIERGLRRDGLMIRSVDRERVERLLFEARKIGVNINQIARGMNAGYKGYSQKHLDGALREAERVMREIRQEFTSSEGEQE